VVKIKTFISYSHDSEEHKVRVRSLSDQLCDDGIDCEIDQYQISPPEGWPRWCVRQVEDSRFVLVICTETYLGRFNGKASEGTGKGVKFEGYFITQELYDSDTLNTKFIPVVFSKEDSAFIPKPLKGSTLYILDSEEGYKDLYRHLTGQPAVPKPNIGEVKHLASKERKGMFKDKPTIASSTSPRVFVSKLPQTGARLFGRERELALLDSAWVDPQSNIVCFSAMGGAGKTSLVKNWLNTLSLDNYRGALCVYAWSFYSQGTREGAQVSADEFFDHALRWFGYSGPLITSA
jgi:SEFIR domain-containing protein